MKVANLVKAYVEKYKHMRKHKKTDGEDTREVENWEQATARLTWTDLVLAVDTGNNRPAVTSHCKQSAEKQDDNRLYLWILLLNCFHMGMNLGFFGLPTAVELNNNQMPQTSRVIRGETQKRFMFGTPGLLQFLGLLWPHFWAVHLSC